MKTVIEKRTRVSYNEMPTFSRLLDLYPSGILSVVSDTMDFWGILTNVLPALHDKIMARDGKLVIRPDSGDPADIICGTDGVRAKELHDYPDIDRTPEQKGAIELLWDLFGGTVNEKGYKVLDPHVGLIYGDSMNFARINDICKRLEAKGFCISPVVFGLGSYGYQYQTRDTFGFAMKATNVTINGEEKAIFKDPKTDDGLKKSLKGRITVLRQATGPGGSGLIALDDSDPHMRDKFADRSLLQTVWKDGKFVREWGFDEVRANAQK